MSVTNVRLQPQAEQSLEQQRWQDTLQALDAVNRGRAVSGSNVHAWLKSWGRASDKNKMVTIGTRLVKIKTS